MRTIFLSQSYPPDTQPRAIQVDRLVRHVGIWPLTVVCEADNRHSEASPTESGRLAADRLRASVISRVLRTASRVFLSDRFLVPDASRFWASDAADHILRHHAPASSDVLVTFGQPMSDHLAGLKIKRRIGTRWIAHFSDPWTDNPFRRDGNLARRTNVRMEAAVMAAADRLIFTSDETVRLVMRKYPREWAGKIKVLPHAFEDRLYPQPVPRACPPVIVRHLGSFYGPRSPKYLFEPLRRLLRRRNDLMGKMRVELIGSVADDTDLAGRETLPADVLVFHPSVDYAAALRLMADADLLLIVDAPSDVSVFLPSKLIDYVGAGRPILGITPPGAAAVLIQSLGGEAFAPTDIDGIESALEQAVDRALAGASEYPWGQADIRERFRAERVGTEMRRIIEDLAA